MSYQATLVGAGSKAPVLSKQQIQDLVDARSEAKATRDFGKADEIRLQLAKSCVQIDDAASAWTCQINGLSGIVQVVMSRQPRDASATTGTAAEKEAEKRRLKNKKKREGKEKKAAALAGDGDVGQAASQAVGQAVAGAEGEVASGQSAKRAKTEE